MEITEITQFQKKKKTYLQGPKTLTTGRAPAKSVLMNYRKAEIA